VPQDPLFSGEYVRVAVQVPPDLFAELGLEQAIKDRKASDIIVRHLRASLQTTAMGGPDEIAQCRRDSELLLRMAPLALSILHGTDKQKADAAAKKLSEAIINASLRKPTSSAAAGIFNEFLQAGEPHNPPPEDSPQGDPAKPSRKPRNLPPNAP
jgi:hypothetical protein